MNLHAVFLLGVLVVAVGMATKLWHTHLIGEHSDFSMSDVEHRLLYFVAYLYSEVSLRGIAVSAMDPCGTEYLPIVVSLTSYEFENHKNIEAKGSIRL